MVGKPENIYSARAMVLHEGDPEGRRRARQRALKLAEANRLAEILRAALVDARHPFKLLDELQSSLAQQERIEWQRAEGRVESRRKRKLEPAGTGQPNRPLNFLFIDESGVSWPQPHKANDVLALGAVALTDEAITRHREAIRQLKLEFWGREEVVFHEPLLRKHGGAFYFDGDADKQRAFCRKYREVLDSLDFVVFGSAVRKSKLISTTIADSNDHYFPSDMYGLAIHLLLERYTDFVATALHGAIGSVSFERQGPREDAEHQLEYARLLVNGTQWISATEFQHLLQPGITFLPKRPSHPMELADLVAREIFEWTASDCRYGSDMWDILTAKIYKRDDAVRGKFGVKVFPDSDIREQIMRHRALGEN